MGVRRHNEGCKPLSCLRLPIPLCVGGGRALRDVWAGVGVLSKPKEVSVEQAAAACWEPATKKREGGKNWQDQFKFP